MSIYSQTHKKNTNYGLIFSQILVAVAGGITIFFTLVILFLLGYQIAYAGKIFPGIHVNGVDLSGLSREEAETELLQEITFPQTGKIIFKNGENLWTAAPQDLGLTLDAAASAQAAYRVGRHGGAFSRIGEQYNAWRDGISFSPLLIYNEQFAFNYLGEIAETINKPTIEASLVLNGTEVTALPGQIGRELDISATLPGLEKQLRNLSDGIIDLVVEDKPPEIMDASDAAITAEEILSQPLVLLVPEAGENDPGPWTIAPEQLALMIKIESVNQDGKSSIQVRLNPEALETYLSAIAQNVARSPEDARFIFNDETRQLDVIQPAVIGRQLNIDQTIIAINQEISNGKHQIDLIFFEVQPEIGDDTTAADLQITELVSVHTTYFRGSSKERLHNIKTAAANFHGLLIPPGATFSMADAMGNVSLDTGYAEAWIIYGGRTIKGVGGGVCQVSTTLFRTVFFGGYPVIERHPHAYRVYYYEQTATGYNANLAGLDATVYVPVVDFKFKNDRPYWLLMETYFNPTARSLTWKFYSTDDGRIVDWSTTGPINVVEPPEPIYEENPELPKGKIKQVDWAADGADVKVTRTVTLNDEVIIDDVFTTHYMPWRDVFQYGPGTKLPGETTTKKKKKK
jgi:vancomycin resistance protein YoaR